MSADVHDIKTGLRLRAETQPVPGQARREPLTDNDRSLLAAVAEARERALRADLLLNDAAKLRLYNAALNLFSAVEMFCPVPALWRREIRRKRDKLIGRRARGFEHICCLLEEVS